jgi:hypothetical protein
MHLNSESISNEIDESDVEREKHDETPLPYTGLLWSLFPSTKSSRHLEDSQRAAIAQFSKGIESINVGDFPKYRCNSVIGPCNFWFFGMAKKEMKDRGFRTVQDILRRLAEIWNDLAFEDVQSVFREWQTRPNWVMENGGGYIPSLLFCSTRKTKSPRVQFQGSMEDGPIE